MRGSHLSALHEEIQTTHDKLASTGLLTVFDRLRRKRNTALYDDSGFVSRHDAEEAITTARDYPAVIGADIVARRPKA